MNILTKANSVITYTVSKSQFNQCYISIENGEVLVEAPWYFSKKQIQKVVNQKTQWIIQKLKEYEADTIAKKDRNTLKEVKIFGKLYQIEIFYQNINNPALNVNQNVIEICLPLLYKRSDNKNLVNVMIDKMYQTIAEKELDFIMEKARHTFGFAPENFEIQKLQNAVATCIDKKEIIIAPSIVMFDKETIEYIVFHEFCHLEYKTHSKKFYELLKKYKPNYETLCLQLKGLTY